MSSKESNSDAQQPHGGFHRKPINSNHKSERGCPEMYDELKERTNISITATARRGLDLMSEKWQISRSELIERLGRQALRELQQEGSGSTQDLIFAFTPSEAPPPRFYKAK